MVFKGPQRSGVWGCWGGWLGGYWNMGRARSSKIWRECGWAGLRDEQSQRWFREYEDVKPVEKEEKAGQFIFWNFDVWYFDVLVLGTVAWNELLCLGWTKLGQVNTSKYRSWHWQGECIHRLLCIFHHQCLQKWKDSILGFHKQCYFPELHCPFLDWTITNSS